MAKAKAKAKEPRVVPLEGLGSVGDIRDRFRNAYKPGANPAPVGFGNPITAIKKIGRFLRPRSPSTLPRRPATRGPTLAPDSVLSASRNLRLKKPAKK